VSREFDQGHAPRPLSQADLAEACPKCPGGRLIRSRTRGLERIVRYFFPVMLYRCDFCGWRGFAVSGEAWFDWTLKFRRAFGPVVVLTILLSGLALFLSEQGMLGPGSASSSPAGGKRQGPRR
jgi:hypothetical protein